MPDPRPLVLLALGSNLGNQRQMLASAVGRLGCWLDDLAASDLYRTAPRYVEDQPAFLNMALCGRAALSPFELLAVVQSIESSLGRERSRRYGPRSIDIDIVYHGDSRVRTGPLTIPHPLRAERRFVLAPLADLAPDFVDPESGRTIQEMLRALPEEQGEFVSLGPLLDR
ncbi:MAG: 2-amino-4-hydroxy-6-hydroxymethyldihydropteridine diphosphokinase [Alphaproteobacteria bacterium]